MDVVYVPINGILSSLHTLCIKTALDIHTQTIYHVVLETTLNDFQGYYTHMSIHTDHDSPQIQMKTLARGSGCKYLIFINSPCGQRTSVDRGPVWCLRTQTNDLLSLQL